MKKPNENSYANLRRAKALVGAFGYPEFITIEAFDTKPDPGGNIWFKWPKNAGNLPLAPHEYEWLEDENDRCC